MGSAMGLAIGFAVGATGIGGIVLVPFLTLALGIDVQRAIAAALVSYIPSGLVAVWLYARRGSIRGRMALPLVIASSPAAFLGAVAAGKAPAGLLEALIGLIMLLGGINGLWPRKEAVETRMPGPPVLAGLGGITGFLAAMTGAGGALILMPLLMLYEAPVLLSIGLGQSIALPIATVATITNLSHGAVDVEIALMLAVSLSVGIAIGTPVAHALPQAVLKGVLSAMIVVLGLAMLARLAWRWM